MKLSGALSAGEEIVNNNNYFDRVLNDGSGVIYIVRGSDNDKIYKASAEGGTPTLLASLPSDGRVVSDLKIAPDDLYAMVEVYQNQVSSLYLLPLDGSSGLQAMFNAGGGNLEYEWSADGRFVVYQSVSSTGEGYDYYNLRSMTIPADTSISPENSVYLNKRSSSLRNLQFKITPDSQYVVYVAAETTPDEYDLYRVPIGGGDLLSYSVAGGTSITLQSDISKFMVSSDGSKVACLVRNEGDDYAIFAVSPTGEGLTRIVQGEGNMALIAFSDEGKRLIYKRTLTAGEECMLFSVSTAAGADCPTNTYGTVLSGAHVDGGFNNEKLTKGDAYLIYLEDTINGDSEVYELYSKSLRSEWKPSTRQLGADWNFISSYWDGGMPSVASEVIVSNSKFCGLSQSTTEVHSLQVRGEAGYDAILKLIDAPSLSAPAGVTVDWKGVLKGGGAIDTGNSETLIESGGRIEAGAGETLSFSSTGELALLNRGNLTAIGSGMLSSEMSKIQVFAATENRGTMVAENAVLRFDEGLANYGTINIGDYVLVHGNVEHAINSGGSININGQCTFYDTVSNGAGFYVQNGGNLMIEGALEGYGIFSTGTGLIQLNGIVSPGFEGDTHIQRMTYSPWIYQFPVVQMLNLKYKNQRNLHRIGPH